MTTEDRNKVTPDPDSTWGATEEAKLAWDKKYGEPKRRQEERERKQLEREKNANARGED